MKHLTMMMLAAASAACAQAPGPIALRGARVVTVSGPVLEKGTVLLRNGLIEAVGENINLPKDAWVIDGQGVTVYPGLIDGLSTVGLPETPAQSTTPRAEVPATPRFGNQEAAMPVEQGPQFRPFTTTWVRAADLLNPADRRIEETRSAGFTSVVAFPSTGIFAGEGAFVNLSGEKQGRMVVVSPAGQYVTLRSQGFGTYPGSLMGVIAYIRQVSFDADHYKLEMQAYTSHPAGQKRPNYDRAVEGLLESPRLLLPADNAKQLDRMIRFAAELKRPAVLYGGQEAYKIPDRVAKSSVPLLVNLKWPEKPKDADPDAEETFRTLELRDRAPSTPAALEKAGARFAFYSGGTAAKDLRKAVKRAIDAGLTESAAVRALTLSAAEIYGVADRVGSIEPGKIANLLVVKGSLFDDKSKIQYIFIDGVKYEPVAESPSGPPGRGAAAEPGGVE
ncbi:MAG TPA: amidohydrolase family protein [Bryobacteraceae bacterium]|nr:amidohydrolase family protein [Bryobacteraceae bacterium]